ncbi:MAG: corrinoid protein [Candidatus Lokiarchaeota archaeon]|nr:corrinoid protein [Candidatus Lokiarchaeota archaeon]
MSSEQLFEGIKNAIVDLDREECLKLAQEALDAGINPLEVIENGLKKGIQIVGTKYDDGELFIVDLMMAASAMKAAVELLELHISAELKQQASAGKIIIGTVEGDVHDIGKTIVSTLLAANGFEVIDLGTEVPSSRFVEKVKELKPDIVGMSALLTTTMPQMQEVIEALEKEDLRDSVKVMVGGAPVTQEFAEKIGADGYAKDAEKAVKWAKELTT